MKEPVVIPKRGEGSAIRDCLTEKPLQTVRFAQDDKLHARIIHGACKAALL